MCGRYASTRSSTDLATLFDALDTTDEALVPDYNLAPTDPAPIVRMSASARANGRSASSRAEADGRSASSRAEADGRSASSRAEADGRSVSSRAEADGRSASSRAEADGRILAVARWGLVPAWSADARGGARMINARAETVATSRAFASSFERRRCLVPADGWYEWAREAGRKQPYFMTRADGEPLVFGGIWSTWGTQSAQLLTFSVITLPAAGELTRVHDRMPLVLSPDLWSKWLNDVDALGFLRPPAEDYAAGIELRMVSNAVSDVRNDGPDLIAPITESADQSIMETLF